MIHEHQVRERAYYIWENEGRVSGQAEAHWFRAKAELAASIAEVVTSVRAVAETSAAPSPAKVLKPAAARARTKTKAPAKAAKAEAPKAAAKPRRSPRTAAAGIALH